MAATAQAKDRFADYVPVNERLERFYSDFPEGRVLTAILEHEMEAGFILMRAEVYRSQEDNGPAATGHAFEYKGEGYVNKTSYIENCETSAVGRALALLGYEIKRGIASREEMQKVERHSGPTAVTPPVNPTVERNVLLKGVMDARRVISEEELKTGGLEFSPQRLTEFINETFRVTDGTNSLSIEQLRQLLKMLSDRVDATRLGGAPSGPLQFDPDDMPEIPMCDCAIARVRKEGVKNGKKWAGWFCANKVKEHAPIWIDLNAEAEGEEIPF